MACGLVVISTANMGSKDVLQEGQGCLISPLALAPFVDRIQCLIKDPLKRHEIAARVRAYVQHWSSQAKARDMLAFYARTLGRETLGQVLDDLPTDELVVERIKTKAGPLDVLEQVVTGVMHQDLATAVKQALLIDGDVCRRVAQRHSWEQIAKELLAALMPVNSDKYPAVSGAKWANPATPA